MTYEDVVPLFLREIAEELGLEEPAWYVGRPATESQLRPWPSERRAAELSHRAKRFLASTPDESV